MEGLKPLLFLLLPPALLSVLAAGGVYMFWKLAIVPHESAAARRRFRVLSCLVILALFGDEIWGQAEVRLLCLGSDVGVSINKKVRLTPEYLASEGLSLPIQDEEFRNSSLRELFNKTVRRSSDPLGPVDRIVTQLSDANTGEVLGRVTRYSFPRGWLLRNFPFMTVNSVGCKKFGSHYRALLEGSFIEQ